MFVFFFLRRSLHRRTIDNGSKRAANHTHARVIVITVVVVVCTAIEAPVFSATLRPWFEEAQTFEFPVSAHSGNAHFRFFSLPRARMWNRNRIDRTPRNACKVLLLYNQMHTHTHTTAFTIIQIENSQAKWEILIRIVCALRVGTTCTSMVEWK